MRLTTSHMKTSPLSFPKAASKAGIGAAELCRDLPRRPQTLVGLQHPQDRSSVVHADSNPSHVVVQLFVRAP